MVKIDGHKLSLEEVYRVAYSHEAVVLDAAAREFMNRTRGVVEEKAKGSTPIYGINTGVGKLSEVKIGAEEVESLQVNIIRSHAVGVGKPLEPPFVRAAILLRANTLAKGYSGTRPEVVDKLLEFLNKGIVPYVPEKGSVGASGDLAPLAHIALALIGEGYCIEDGRKIPTLKMLDGKGVLPIKLRAKEGLSLINGTQASSAIIAILLKKSINLLYAANFISSLVFLAQYGVFEELDERIQKIRPHEGQKKVADYMRHLIKDAPVLKERRKVQDAYSIRCIPQVHGAVLDMLEFAKKIIETEINSTTDNPLVFENGDIISNGNFHGQYPAYAGDVAGIALTTLSSISDRRSFRLLTPELSMGLPAFLAKNSGINSGFMMLQVTQASLVAQNRLLAAPASVHSIPTSGDQEDSVSQSMNSALKLREIYDNTLDTLAIELLIALQAVRLRGMQILSPRLRSIVESQLDFIDFVESDMVYQQDMEKSRDFIENTDFSKI